MFISKVPSAEYLRGVYESIQFPRSPGYQQFKGETKILDEKLKRDFLKHVQATIAPRQDLHWSSTRVVLYMPFTIIFSNPGEPMALLY